MVSPSISSDLSVHDGNMTADFNLRLADDFSHLFQGLFQTGDRMVQWQRLWEARTHHL